jgi:membrane-associated phospholipid phosphatase
LTATQSGLERRATNRLFALYMLVSGSALLFRYHQPGWLPLLLLHIAVATLCWRPELLHGLRGAFPRIAEVFADWYPLLSIIFLYGELAILNVAVWNGRYFDTLIQYWEGMIFGGQPSRELAAQHPNLVISELLHASYLSYYFIIFAPPIILYLLGRRSEQRRAVFTVMLAFFAHYLFFIFFPVQGPRYLFAAPSGPLAQGSVYQLTHRVLEAGSSRGAAFPSSHVGVAVAQTVMTIKYLPRLAPVTVILTLGLALGAVYGGFHYATDACAGLLLGLVCALAAPRVQRLLAR